MNRRWVSGVLLFLLVSTATAFGREEEPPLTRERIAERRPTDAVSGSFVYPFAAYIATPDSLGIPFETVRFSNTMGVSLSGWFLDRPDTDRTLLVCMGNMGNISYMLLYAQILYEAGFDVFLFDYQGFGGSDGVASALSIAGDAKSAWRYLREVRGLGADRIGVLGVSLGSVLSLMVAAAETPRAIAVEDVFHPKDFVSDLREMAKGNFAMRAGLMLLENTVLPAVDPLSNLDRIACPTMLIHGETDWLLPPAGTIVAADAARGPTRLWMIPEVGHAPEPLVAIEREYGAQLSDFFRDAFDEQPFPVAKASFELLSSGGSSAADSAAPAPPSPPTPSTDAAVADDSAAEESAPAPVRVAVTGTNGHRPFLVTLADREGNLKHLRIYADAPAAKRIAKPKFRPDRISAIEYLHVVDEGDGTWREAHSELSASFRAFAAFDQDLFDRFGQNPVRMEQVGRVRWAVREYSSDDWEWTRQRLPSLDAVDERIRPYYGEAISKLAIGLGDEALREEAARAAIAFFPQDPLRYYRMGNASFSVGFEGLAPALACQIAAKEAARKGDLEAARRLASLYLDVLPAYVEPGIKREEISAIRSAKDLEF